MKNKKWFLPMLTVTTLAFTGCGSGSDGNPKAASGDEKPTAISSEPITLKVYQNGLSITDQEFNQYFVKPVSSKYPNITLSLVRTAPGTMPEELVASGAFPDIIFAANPVFNELKKINVVADLNELVKKNKVDLSKFDSTAVDAIKLYGNKGELYALPFARNFGGLFYNKDLFDKVGVPYPTDGMDWDSVAELGRKVARTEAGVVYRGFEPGEYRVFGNALSLQFFDPVTKKVTLNNEGWAKALKKLQDIYSIPNNLPPEQEFGPVRANFVQRKHTAMITDWVNGISGELEKAHAQGQGLNWDVVSQPNFKEKAGIGRNVDIQSLLLSSTTKYKDEAFAVIDHLTSRDAQITLTKTGRLAAMNSPEIEKQYAADLESFKGKNIAGIFKTKPAQLYVPSDYDQTIFKVMAEATKRAGFSKEDVNTVLRELEEKANKQVAQEMTAAK
jgi:multiple sugar transport system substrate-binding protein